MNVYLWRRRESVDPGRRNSVLLVLSPQASSLKLQASSRGESRMREYIVRRSQLRSHWDTTLRGIQVPIYTFPCLYLSISTDHRHATSCCCYISIFPTLYPTPHCPSSIHPSTHSFILPSFHPVIHQASSSPIPTTISSAHLVE